MKPWEMGAGTVLDDVVTNLAAGTVKNRKGEIVLQAKREGKGG